ncbi:MAG: DUF5060 domain-containing protein [Bacteroidota bacterium]
MGKLYLFLFLSFYLGNIPKIKAQIPVVNTIHILTETAEQYQKWEARIDISASFQNPYDFDQIRIEGLFTHADGVSYTVDGFYMQPYAEPDLSTGATMATGSGEFRIRFAPPYAGNWQVQIRVITPTGSAIAEPIDFSSAPASGAATKGYVRTSATNYLQFDNGEACIPIGQNVGWQTTNAITNYKQWMDKMAEKGGNFLRLWQCHWGLGLEWLGGDYGGMMQYRQLTAFYTDWLFEYAMEKGIFIMYALQHHGQVSSTVNPNWSENPYNIANGGPCANTWDFFINEQAIKMTKNRYRYVVARWGYARSIMAWELFNEVDWTDQFEQRSELIAEWHLEMASYLKSIDPYQHLVTTSYARDQYDPAVWSSPSIDITQTHFYFDSPNLERILKNGVQDYLANYEKPTLNGEFGISHNGDILSELDPDGIHFHNGLWGSLFGGGLGSAMSWWWDNYVAPQQLYYHFTPLAAQAATIDWIGGNFKAIETVVGGPRSDLLISPDQGWASETDAHIQISNTGEIISEGNRLGFFLYGAAWNTQYRNPPTFLLDLDEPQEFGVLTGGSSGQGPNITISIDGLIVLSEAAETEQWYTVMVPAGQHEVLVDNTGTDWITISNYKITNLGFAIDAYVLSNEDGNELAGWLLNNQYNHQNAANNQLPTATAGATLTVEGISDGNYYIYFRDCLSGGLLAEVEGQAVEGLLTFTLPDIHWDLSFRAFSAPVTSASVEADAIEFASVFPNPVTAYTTTLKINVLEASPVQIILHDAAGKALSTLYRGQLISGEQQIELSLPFSINSGMYWIQVSVDGVTRTLPISVVRS